MTMPSLFVPHGGGPCFFLNPGAEPDPMWRPMRDYLAGVVASLPERPRAILLVSGHWEEERVTLHHGDGQPLLYDYYGFPAHTYALQWPAPGAPDVAARAAELLEQAGFETGAEHGRGWDHGVFIPMMVAVPGADIPLAQMSLRQSLDPAEHLAIGRALAPLRDEGVLIVGSGMSFHNLRERGARAAAPSATWDAALAEAATDPDPARRAERLAAWEVLPNARYAHPREEHLLPLMVAVGAGGDDPARLDWRGEVLGWAVSAYRFG
ncbi:dioxygenase [Sphingomonas sp. PL-96]|uniref:DODA-type extradiol aromatic ring-opening family dioxygenase n=1 Tax=Sphingomonas sp. PL-96 TaxID=2887201 RepID=UPI001E4CC2EE|nr:class III extradiol ring-cleavage dioxygenase [Sphingomonas sp. PL-96]MCC2976695.1 dioxygenase [Sphingomonas sp. PL-96]